MFVGGQHELDERFLLQAPPLGSTLHLLRLNARATLPFSRESSTIDTHAMLLDVSMREQPYCPLVEASVVGGLRLQASHLDTGS